MSPVWEHCTQRGHAFSWGASLLSGGESHMKVGNSPPQVGTWQPYLNHYTTLAFTPHLFRNNKVILKRNISMGSLKSFDNCESHRVFILKKEGMEECKQRSLLGLMQS